MVGGCGCLRREVLVEIYVSKSAVVRGLGCEFSNIGDIVEDSLKRNK